MLTLAIWLRALSYTSDSLGGRNGRLSFTKGLSARLTSRKMSFCVSRSIFMPVACSEASTPDMRLLNSATRSSCSRETGKEEALLRQCLRNPACAVHAPDGVQHPLPAVGKSALRFFRLKAIAGCTCGADGNGQAELAG